jgi:glycosyltransferase involved in cell wall biosynthesis
MLTTENGTATAPDTEHSEHRGNGLTKTALHSNGAHCRVENRLHAALPLPPTLNGEKAREDTRPVLALFCHEDPGSEVGRFVGKLAGAAARRQVAVHMFSRKPFDLDAADVTVHVLGECDHDDLLDRVQEFTHRACNGFLKQFQTGSSRVTLMAFEWSAIPALSILRSIKDVDTILSLQSLERQRSDMSSELNKRIEEIELSGLREAKRILTHEPATAEVAKHWVPECADRIVPGRQPFPVQHFPGELDPGAVKARYQVGPVDPTILYIGDLDERYGPDLLVKAMPGVLKNHKQARLIVVGDGNLYWPLRVYVRYLLLEHAVRLVGHVEDKPLRELIQAADIIAVPSREGTPWWPILAAWAARRPVVATHEAAPGLLAHEQDSVLCYPSPDSCVWGIERVLFDPELGRTVAKQGREKLEERFGWNSVAAQVEELMGVQRLP